MKKLLAVLIVTGATFLTTDAYATGGLKKRPPLNALDAVTMPMEDQNDFAIRNR